jgi:hypothetical protein
MARIAHSFSIVRQSVKSYSESPLGWKPADTDDAMRCWDFEEYLEIGIVLFDAITHFDEKYRERVLEGTETWDPAIDASITEAYQWWCGPCDQVLKQLQHFEANYGTIRNAEKFRQYVREAKGILGDVSAVFDSDKLAELRDQAIDSFRRGDTLEYGSGQS